MGFNSRNKEGQRKKPTKKEVGNLGEDVAVKYLQRLGYEIHERNVRLHRDEIDVIAFDPKDEVMVFVEVKTRTRQSMDFYPEMDAHPRKMARIRRSARQWVGNHDFDGGYRLDLICVVDNRVDQHMKELPWGDE